MKHRAPQFEMPFAATAFNLAQETTLDGEAAQRLAEQAARHKAEAELQQLTLHGIHQRLQHPAGGRP
jgi:hypothetical protein